jgi:hypothetical protein
MEQVRDMYAFLEDHGSNKILPKCLTGGNGGSREVKGWG